MKTLPPLTAELKGDRAIIVDMLGETLSVLEGYTHLHPGKLHHISEEATLLCRNLLLHLQHLSAPHEHDGEESSQLLSSFLGDADALDAISARIHAEGGDYRLTTALRLLAESFRLTGPAILRWRFDYSGQENESALDLRWQRFKRVIKPLADDLAAA